MFECFTGQSPGAVFGTLKPDPDDKREDSAVKQLPVSSEASSGDSSSLPKAVHDEYYSNILAADTRPVVFDHILGLAKALATTQLGDTHSFLATSAAKDRQREQIFAMISSGGASARDFIVSLLQQDPRKRLTASKALESSTFISNAPVHPTPRTQRLLETNPQVIASSNYICKRALAHLCVELCIERSGCCSREFRES